jgi:hypothetical protein
MSSTRTFVLALLFSFPSVATNAGAQSKPPVETRNAALRYWMAFALLQDTAAYPETAVQLQKTLDGEVAWDDAKLGRIVDDNIESIQTMQRATSLPECDWGLEYGLGPATPIVFVKNSSRALARLNTLYGIRLFANDDLQKAIDAWLAGVRFSEDVARGGSLFATLVAKAGLSADLKMLTKAAASGRLTSEQKQHIATAIRGLPESGFDWGEAMRYEGVSMEVLLKSFSRSDNPSAVYEKWFEVSAPANFSAPSGRDTANFYKWHAAVESALRLPPDQASARLKALQESVGQLHPLFRAAIPQLERINAARQEVANARRDLLRVLATK